MTDAEWVQVVAAGTAEHVIRRSRFLGLLQACASREEAAQQLAECRGEHDKATHHVSAWRLWDATREAIRTHHDDDGEPGGTAGRPTLQALETHHLMDAQLIVVRYFGGIKLGAGGLVRAYGQTALEAVRAARLAPVVRTRRMCVRVAYPQLAAVEAEVTRRGLHVTERRFDPQPELRLEIPEADVAAVRRALRDATGGRAVLEELPG